MINVAWEEEKRSKSVLGNVAKGTWDDDEQGMLGTVM